jgi:hypothetical protein
MKRPRAYKRDGSTVTRTYTLPVRTANRVSEFAKERNVPLGAALDAIIRYTEWDKVEISLRDDLNA